MRKLVYYSNLNLTCSIIDFFVFLSPPPKGGLDLVISRQGAIQSTHFKFPDQFIRLQPNPNYEYGLKHGKEKVITFRRSHNSLLTALYGGASLYLGLPDEIHTFRKYFPKYGQFAPKVFFFGLK